MKHSAALSLIVLALAVSACDYVPSWAGGSKKVTEKLGGDRIPVLRSATTLAADPTLSTAMDVPTPTANDQWPQHSGHVDAATGNLVLAGTLAREQSATIGDGNDFSFELVIPPVVDDGAVFAMDGEGAISAHDVKDVSEIRWISPGVATDDDEPIMGGGLAYDAGRVIATSGRGLVVGLDAKSGTELWRQAINIPIRSAPRIADGRAYVVTVDSQLFALDVANGSVLWSHRGINEGTGILIEATPAANADIVAAPYSSGEVHVLRADDGSEVWSDVVMGPQRQSATAIFTGIGGDPLIENGVLYVAGSAGQCAAFQLQNGRRIWEQPVSSIHTPWITGDYLFVLTSDSQVIAFNRLDGRVRWIRPLPVFEDEENSRHRYTWSGPVMAGGRLLVVGAHGVMMEISPQDGSILAATEIPDGLMSSPVVAGGVAYVVRADATLYAIY